MFRSDIKVQICCTNRGIDIKCAGFEAPTLRPSFLNYEIADQATELSMSGVSVRHKKLHRQEMIVTSSCDELITFKCFSNAQIVICQALDSASFFQSGLAT